MRTFANLNLLVLKRTLACTVVLMAFSIMNCIQLQAQTYVKLIATGSGSGVDWDNAVGANGLLPAIESGGTVYIAEGIYIPGEIFMDINIPHFVQGGFPNSATGTDISGYNPILYKTIIDGNTSDRIIDNSSRVDNITLKGLVLQNGDASSDGSAFRSTWSDSAPIDFLFIDLEVKNNYASLDGTVTIENKDDPNGKITFKNCTFHNNESDDGAALNIHSVDNGTSGSSAVAGNFVIDNCVFRDNLGTINGGAINLGSSPAWIIKNSSFCDNVSTNHGAHIYATNSAAHIIDSCIFSNGYASDDGGAIYFTDASATISNTLFLGNEADNAGHDGGAIFLTGSSVNLDNCDFYNNVGRDGGAIFSATWYETGFTNSASNCTFYNNQSTSTSIGAEHGGGALLSRNSTNGWDIDNCVFVNNVVNGLNRGGAIANGDAQISLTNSLFYNNMVGNNATIAGADISNYDNPGGFNVMSGNQMQLSNSGSYVNASGSTDPSSYAFSNDTFSNTDDGSVPAAPTPQCIVIYVEICGNGLDDDYDGYTDDTDPDCGNIVYAITDGIQNTTGYQWDTLTIPAQDVASNQEFGLHRSTEYSTADGWNHYYNVNEPGKYLFSIEMGANTTEIEYVEIRVEEFPDTLMAFSNTNATFAMPRDWHVQTVGGAALTAPVNIRFYYTAAELQGLLNNAIAVSNNDPTSTAPTINDIVWFKKETYNPTFDINPDASNLLNGAGYTVMVPNVLPNALGESESDTTTFGNNVNYVQFNGLTGFSGGSAYITITGTALPVELSSFNAKSDGCNVDITWVVESENDFSHYELEWSASGSDYVKLTSVIGNNREAKFMYNHQHKSNTETNYYRLKMVDMDGNFEYSKVIFLKSDCINSNLTIYPNPIEKNSEKIQVNLIPLKDTGEFMIVNMQGNVVNTIHLELQPNISNHIEVDVTELPVGMYYLVYLENRWEAKVFSILE